ncbi:MAG: hypothetical protein MMC23_008538 [Stictis urceolatum]|nr:hypothetical protein [Stictis urceolata]
MSYYTVLGLSPNPDDAADLGAEDIKAAYRKALLAHHPDKSLAKKVITPPGSRHAIDAINDAYKVLSDSHAKLEYDRVLKLQGEKPQNGLIKEHPGLETVDLDDMQLDETNVTWYRACRCGRDRGFEVLEAELEKEAEHGEIIIGCDGCSLWLRVVFQTVDEA